MSMRAVQGLEVQRQLNAENGRIPYWRMPTTTPLSARSYMARPDSRASRLEKTKRLGMIKLATGRQGGAITGWERLALLRRSSDGCAAWRVAIMDGLAGAITRARW